MKYVIATIVIILGFWLTAGAQAVRVFTSEQVGTNPQDGFCLTTNGATSTWGPCTTGGSGSPGGTNGQLQFNNAGSFGGTSSPSVGFINATSLTASSTLPNIISQAIRSLTSAGLTFFSNSGSPVADFGAGGGTNATFFGGVNINGQTRIATNLTGIIRADNGILSTTTVAGGSASGTINVGTIGQLAVYTASTTLSGSSSPTLTGLSVTGSTTLTGYVRCGPATPPALEPAPQTLFDCWSADPDGAYAVIGNRS